MKCHLSRATGAALALGAALACLTSAKSSSAETTVVTQPVATPAAETTSHYVPNRALIGTGVVTFGLSYIPAVVVAAESPQSADHHLYVPVVGPWLDLGNRPACGVNSIACDTETTNKVLIAADGVFQGLGVIAVVAGFLTPEREVVTAASAPEKPSVHVTPAQLGAGGYGVAALGKF
ncbi:MAG TPA: hypothetical protein VE987_16675 [Polyangiaceae bacterium]|nr:hypothetical protein [Polyangiaceae bacterium]